MALTINLTGVEPAFSKNTAFNKNFGTSSGDILLLGSTSVASKVLVTDSNNKVKTSSTTETQLSYLDATSSIQTQLGDKVPYTGANANVNLGEYEIKAGQLTLDITPTGTAAVGTTQWNDTHGISETTLKGGSVVLKNGMDLVARVVNKVTPNATLTKANYTAVRVSGATGQRLSVEYAKADIDLNSADTIGLVTETIATNQEGFIITMGQLLEINTTGSLQGETWADGDVLYLSPSTAGRITNIKPTGATGHIVVMGYVEYAHAVHGKIYVKIMNGWELDELHNVYINGVANNNLLAYESSTSLWKNKTASTLGLAPLASPTFTGTVTSPAIILSSETASTIASFDASKNIKSLPLATYPSLTELSYVKGVTSAIQTQFDNVGEFIQLGGTTFAPADSTTYFFGLNNQLAPGASTASREFSFIKTGTVTRFMFTVSMSVAGTSENVAVSLRNITTATDNSIGNITMDAGTNGTGVFNFTPSITIANTTDRYTIKFVAPAWVTNPTGVYSNVRIFNKY